MPKRLSYVDYQKRALEFNEGDVVYHHLSSSDVLGRVVAVFPGIGMVDVEFPNGSRRFSVEDLYLAGSNSSGQPPLVNHNSVPGGPTVITSKLAHKLARKHVALYWGARDRQYRPTRQEVASNCYYCPKCKDTPTPLKKAIYKRREGVSERLLGCPTCMFLVKQDDILGF